MSAVKYHHNSRTNLLICFQLGLLPLKFQHLQPSDM